MPFRISQRLFRSIHSQTSAIATRHVHLPPRRQINAATFQRYRYSTTSGKRPVDEKVEELSELYASAKEEFEIAVEETAKNTIYASEDRETAREELEKFKSAYEEAISSSSPEDGQEIKRRVGQRLRELDSAVETLNEADTQEH
ncbi:hypothetical protein TWF694_004175 [Orbilia ellipsospora]|uniref:Uncharacterized protein n=1 Tax=Orbilia ellipsospora TaxID=2528407 RepID=A0AAV9WY66_9PEZI